MIVYMIRNSINGKLYFGITKCSLEKRWREHKHNSLKSKKKTHLCLAIKKYGEDNFTRQVVRYCSSEKDMYKTEINLIKQFNTTNRKFGYNNSIGGEASSKGKVLSEETRKKISDFQKTRVRKPFSLKTIQAMKDAAKGRNMEKLYTSSANKRRGKQALNVRAVILNGETEFVSITEAAKKFNCRPSTIHNNIKGLSKTTKFGIWEYKAINTESGT